MLRVKEARRRFTRKLLRSSWISTRAVAEAEARANGGRIVAGTGNGWLVELWTPEHERRYLCGRDDVNLFIAEVPRGETVLEAHAALKPRAVLDAEARGLGPVLRQGGPTSSTSGSTSGGGLREGRPDGFARRSTREVS
ncbi:MAG TPA: hypothetical protein VHF22_13610 [Planctomycetota bacterium]|nr:hypothetical protein [Planctomycetota bacterium]